MDSVRTFFFHGTGIVSDLAGGLQSLSRCLRPAASPSGDPRMAGGGPAAHGKGKEDSLLPRWLERPIKNAKTRHC